MQKEKVKYVLTKKIVWIWFVLAGLLASCTNEEQKTMPANFIFNFNADVEGWAEGFADYPVDSDSFYEKSFEYSTLPEPLDQNTGALKISGNNHSDDLFMFVKRKVTGLEPNTIYRVEMTVEFASDVPDGTPGVGGSPGESVYIKAGATAQEPAPVIDEDNWYRMNIDKGNQSQGGEDMQVLGDFSNDTDTNEYTLKTVSNNDSFSVTSDENGEVWLIVGSDSGFEATTTIYYNRFEFVLTPA